MFYLLGAIRDGSIPKCGVKKEITLATDPCKEWLEEISKIAAQQFFVPLTRFKIYEVWDRKSKMPCYRLKLYSKNVYECFLNFYPAGEQQNWKTPEAIKNECDSNCVKEYIAGFYDAEGGCRNSEKFELGISKTIQCWASVRCKHFGANEPLIFVKNKLAESGINSNIYDSDELVLTGKQNLRKFYETIPLKHPRKRNDLKRLLIFLGALSADA